QHLLPVECGGREKVQLGVRFFVPERGSLPRGYGQWLKPEGVKCVRDWWQWPQSGRILAVPPRKLETRDGTPRLRGRADRIPSICRLKAAFRWYCQDAPAAAPTKASSWIPICAGYKLVVSV